MDCPIWCQTLAIQALSGNDRHKAIDYFKKALELAPDFKDAWVNMAVAYGQLGEHKNANEAFLKAYELDNRYEKAIRGLVVSYKELKQYDKANEFCDMYAQLTGGSQDSKNLRKMIKEKQDSERKAEQKSQPAKDEGNPMERYGYYSYYGFKTDDWETSIKEFQKLEDEGFFEASITLGQMQQSRVSPWHQSIAKSHFEKAANAGIAEGAWGVAALLGHPYDPDIHGADKEWYKYCLQAAKGGNPDAMHELGKVFHHKRDYLSAFYWFIMSGYYDHPDGHYDRNVLKKYYAEDKEPQNAEFIDGIDKKESENALMLFKILLSEEVSLNKDVMDDIFKRAMAGSELMALFFAHFAEDVRHSFADAKLGFQIAAHNNSIAGQRCLADMQITGKGCERDIQKALSWYQAAAEAGDARACFVIAQAYRNSKMAAFWYTASYRRGFEPALDALLKLNL